MNRKPDFFQKCINLNSHIALSKFTGAEKFREIEKDTIVLLSYQVNEAFCCTKGLYEMKTKERSRKPIFVLIITLMLSRIFSEALTSISNKHKYTTFTKSPPASLLHCIEYILNHSSGKCRDSLTTAALSFTKSTFLFTIFIH